MSLSNEKLNRRDSGPVHRYHDPKSEDWVDPSRWCVTWNDLAKFEKEVRAYKEDGLIQDNPKYPFKHHDNPKIGPNMYQVNRHYIKPVTKKAGGMSWALMQHSPKGCGPCDIFATHAWCEGVYEIISKLRRVWPHGAKYLYCCFLANPQNGDIASILAGPVTMSPFARALSTADWMVVLPNSTQSIYKRLWCVYEAHLAVRATAERGLKIRLPWVVPPAHVINQLIPGIVMPIFGWMVCMHFIAPRLAPALGPGMWLLAGFAACSSTTYVVRDLMYTYLDVEDASMWMVTWYYSELFMLGIFGDLAKWHFDQRSVGAQQWAIAHHKPIKNLMSFQEMNIRWEQGEDKSCCLLGGAVFLVYIVSIIRELVRSVLDREAHELDFESVAKADCSNKNDWDRIWQEIEDNVEEIDATIRDLRVLGRYDTDVKNNIDLGMSRDRVASGVRPFKVIAAVCAWEFWWITDLDGRREEWVANSFFFFSCAIGMVVVYYLGDKCIFAIDSALFFGLVFAIVSNHHFFFTRASVLALDMSRSTLWLQLGLFACMIASDYCFYKGYWKWLRDRGSNGYSSFADSDTGEEEGSRSVFSGDSDPETYRSLVLKHTDPL